MLRLEMLCTGDEVLHGQIIDTNSAWLADYLFQQGIPMRARSTVGDALEDLVSTLQLRSQYADVLIVNGGLGPTSDDLSAQAAADALGERLVEHPEWIAQMEAYFASRGRPMSDSNRKQAMIPASAEMIDNPVGTACGFAIQLNGCWIFFTPGVPSEFKVMVEQQILPRLRQRFTLSEPPLCLRLTTFGRSESGLAQQLDSLPLPPNTTLGYRSSMPIIELKLTGPSSQCEAMVETWQHVRAVAGENCVFEGTAGLPHDVAVLLRERGLRLALSEQFTAGLLSWQLRSADAPLGNGELPEHSGNSSLKEVASRARILATHSGVDLTIALGELQDDCISVVLHSAQDTFGQTMVYSSQRHSQRIRQEMTAMLALDMLRRWLTGQSPYGNYEWLKPTETL